MPEIKERKICKDGRYWGQNNKLAGNHLGILTIRSTLGYQRKLTDIENSNRWKNYGINTRFKKGIKFSKKWRNNLSKVMKGRKFTLEHRKKLSKALLGNKRSYKGGNYCPDCGKKLSSYKPKKCNIHAQIGLQSGNKHPNWKGGKIFQIYPSIFNKQLREKIKVRDNFICQLCRVPELELDKRLCIHHIDYDKNNCQENNLISLCRSCHSKTQTNRNYWIDLFIKKMEVFCGS